MNKYYVEGLNAVKASKTTLESQKGRFEGLSNEELVKKTTDIDINELGLSVRIRNALYRNGFHSLARLINSITDRPEELMKIRNLGEKGMNEIFEKLKEYGIDCSEKRKKFSRYC